MSISRRKFLLGAGAVGVLGAGAAVTPMIRREGTLISTTSRAPYVAGTEGPLPKESDVVIIGAGIQGIMSAINMRERGMSVTIVEKGEVAGEQSGRAYSQIISYKTAPEIFPLHHYGKKLWREMNERVGADTSYRTQGRVEAIITPEELATVQEWIALNSQNPGFDTPLKTRIIQGKELADRLPNAQTAWEIAGFEEDAGSVDPERGTTVLAEYAKRIGVKIFTNCAARGIETEGGKITEVVTEKGAIKTNLVVLANGFWARLFMGNMGVDLPTLNVYLSQQVVEGAEGAPRGNVHLPNGIHFREQSDGTYAVAPRIFTSSITKDSFLLGPKFMHLLGGEDLPLEFKLGSDLYNSFTMKTSWSMDEVTPFEEYRVASATPNNEHLDGVFDRMKAEFPQFADSKVIERWGACIAPTADGAPIISEVEKYPGLVINTATGWGMSESPAAGEITADLIMGRTPIIDPTPYSIKRFS